MDCKTIAEQTLVEHETLQHVKAAMRATIDWEVNSVGLARKLSSVKFISESFRRHLERLMDLEEHGGYMTMVHEINPNLCDRVATLRSEHERFRTSLSQLMPRFEKPAELDEPGLRGLCKDLKAMLDELDRHDTNEIALLHEALLQDEGGEG